MSIDWSSCKARMIACHSWRALGPATLPSRCEPDERWRRYGSGPEVATPTDGMPLQAFPAAGAKSNDAFRHTPFTMHTQAAHSLRTDHSFAIVETCGNQNQSRYVQRCTFASPLGRG